MKHMLIDGERVLADSGYRDSRCLIPGQTKDKVFNRARARHETFNARFKYYNVVAVRFRHKINIHSSCFRAVVNLTHLQLKCDPLFFVNF